MGWKRNDIGTQERMQIGMQVLSAKRTWGVVSDLARQYKVSRQTIYDLGKRVADILDKQLQPKAPGPKPAPETIKVNRNRLQRAVLVLSETGVSQRGVRVCLEELLDTQVSLGWVNGQLANLEAAAGVTNQDWEPVGGETLSGDEIYANGEPNLLVVGNESLYIYALTRPGDCEGDTWGCVLLDVPESSYFASDGGTGLAAGAKAAEVVAHQLDWDHLLRPLWGHVTRLEKKAYAQLQQVEERAAKFDQSHSEKRLQQHLTKWEEGQEQATQKIEDLDDFYRIARQVDDCFAMIDLMTGELIDTLAAQTRLQTFGLELASWSGRIYQKLSKNLQNWATNLFNYQPFLAQALLPLQVEYGHEAISALCRIWQCEADQRRRRLSLPEQTQRQQIWQQALDEAWQLLGESRLMTAWATVAAILGQSWRGSMLAECVNSLLRPVLNRRKHTDQGCLELFRFLHNVRPFARGKRAGHSPAELVDIELPEDPLTLLGLAPKVSS